MSKYDSSLTAENITDIKAVSREVSAVYDISYTFKCKINGVDNELEYTRSRTDDGYNFSIHSKDNDEMLREMGLDEMYKLEDTLSKEAHFYTLTNELNKARSSWEVYLFREGLWDCQVDKLTEERKADLHSLIAAAEKKYSQAEKKQSVKENKFKNKSTNQLKEEYIACSFGTMIYGANTENRRKENDRSEINRNYR